MTHFAKIENNKVVRVIVATKEIIDKNYSGEWIQTSYNTHRGTHANGGSPLRGNYAGIGFDYDRVNDVFISPKPYPSFIFDKLTSMWKAPIDMPISDKPIIWNEKLQKWVLL